MNIQDYLKIINDSIESIGNSVDQIGTSVLESHIQQSIVALNMYDKIELFDKFFQ